jgi:hypothetical protein
MKQPVRKILALFFVGALLGGVLALAQQPSASPQTLPKVVLLPPEVVFEQLTNKPAPTQDATFESILTDTATANLKTHGYTAAPPDGLQQVDSSELLKQLQPLNSRLARGVINDDAQQILKYLAASPDDFLILVQHFAIKNGPGSSWNPYSGAITSSMSSTLLQVALISPKTGKVVWKNEVLERKLFRADDPKLTNIINLLYQTLATTAK